MHKILITKKGIGIIFKKDKEKIIIETDKLLNTLTGDYVDYKEIGESIYGEKLGQVTKIIKRTRNKFSGIYFKKDNFLKVDNFGLYLDLKLEKNKILEEAKDQDKIIVTLRDINSNLKEAIAEPIKILGPSQNHEVETLAKLIINNIDYNFNSQILSEAQEIKNKSINLINEDKKNRKDFRDRITFTIDPKEAKDFDDAISLKPDNNDWELGVHIADPSFFIIPNSLLDKEAQKRANSTYLLDRTIPMLPEVLSNDLCSINPNEDKLTFSIIFKFDKDFNLKNYYLTESIINSNKKFDYEEAQNILNKKEGNYYKELMIIEKISDKLNQENLSSGKIDFEFKEFTFELKENKDPISISIKKKFKTMKIIENLMLLANKKTSEFTENQDFFIFRIHPKPKKDKILILRESIKDFQEDFNLSKTGEISNEVINKILERFKNTQNKDLINSLVLKSMEKAIYSEKNQGHFGLNFQYYSHFTSPIRRYADLINHRILKQYLKKEKINSKIKEEIKSQLDNLNEREVASSDAEKSNKLFKYCQYYHNKLNEEMEVMIININKGGFYAQNQLTGLVGFNKISNIDKDFYNFDENKNLLIGRKSLRKIKLGDKIKVRLKFVAIDEREIEFVVI